MRVSRVLLQKLFVCLAIGLALLPGRASAGTSTYEQTSPPRITATAPGARAFYIEFRGRSEEGGFGHAYMVLGSVGRDGRQHETTVFGFVPKDADDEFWSQFALPVTGMIGVSQSDFTPSPDVAFRVALTRPQHDQLVRDIAGLQESWTTYLLLGHNCNDLMGAVARSLGLWTPLITVQLPVRYVIELQAINTQ